MKTCLFSIAIFLFSQTFYAQNDTLQQEIIKMGTSKTMLISNGRVLLLEKFLEGDMVKVKEIKDYLLSLENENYRALYPGEKWLILFWTKEYQPILNDIRDYKNVLHPNRNKIEPPDDNLFERLRVKSYNHKEDLFQYIENASITNEEKEILDMHLTLGLKKDADTPDITQEQLNDRADWFLKTYPNSYAVDYTREYIRYKWGASNWGWGYEFFLGAGPLTNKLKEHFDVPAYIGLEFSASYKRFHFFQRDFIGLTTTLKDIPSSNLIWTKGADAEFFLWEFSVGYAAIETRKIKLVPFTGIGGSNVEPPQDQIDKYPELSTFKMAFKTTYTIGANLDIKLGKGDEHFVTYTGWVKTRWILRLRYEYALPQFAAYYPGYNGNMHMITVGIGAFSHKIVRQK
ncbi:hypothetical protein [Parabacteroides sp. FAFU027]|uniref:hypothetical protein n=1 Tax=Parabacteroides sp. FAFU027 TaxID=2922715 RepID=UPI001FAFF0CE|nr:hypothetical protein [Parabacteroides sp. FAFU027]